MAKLLQFGAGNIGRSFVGQLFSRAGYQVVFVDIDETIVQALNERRRYRVEVRDTPPDETWVENVRGLMATDVEAVAEELAGCDVAATAVGPNALPHLYPVIARGLLRRREVDDRPLDIILCENLRNAAAVVREGLAKHLPADYSLDARVGLVETSIGKMVPIMTDEDRRRDPLLVFAEAYNTLIVDARAFLNSVPDVPGLDPKDNMAAYVDRKSFIHNLGHAAAAYVGHLRHSDWPLLWQVMGDDAVRGLARAAMWESGRALIRQYPHEFDEANQDEHIEDLLRRFANRALGDTVYRVGRDLPRKLSPDDRMIGALRLQLDQGIEPVATCQTIAAALLFRATDEHGSLFERDAEFVRDWYPRGVAAILTGLCGLDPSREDHRRAIDMIDAAHQQGVGAAREPPPH